MGKDEILENDHNDFIQSELFCQMIQEKIQYSHLHKYDGIAPEGFVLLPELTLERLKDFETWKEWKNNPSMLKELISEDLKNQ
jgi:hypothetical protein